MALTLRNTKGSPLTHSEVDANFQHCAPTSGTTQQNLDLKGSLDANNTWTKAQRGAYVELSTAPVYGTAIDAFSLTPPALSHMKYETSETSLILWREVVTGVTTDVETYAFTSYPTLGELVTAINTVASWTASAIASTTEVMAGTLANSGAQPISSITTIQMNPAEIAISLNDSNNFSFTLVENTTLAAPTDVVEGQSGVIHFTQHASAAKTLAFNAFWYFGATTPTISAAVGEKCVVSYIVEPGATRAICSMGGDIA